MIRMILLSTAFVGVTAGLVVYQPGAAHIRDRLDGETAPAVTRAATGPDSLPPAPERVAAGGADPAAALAALVREAQGGTPPADTAPAAANPVLALTAAVQAAQDGRDGDLARVTSAILADLGKTPAASSMDEDALMAMTQTVLASLGGAQGGAATDSSDLRTLVVQAVRQGQSDAYLDALLNEARNNGQIAVPEALITSDNKVDTATLLATLVQRSVGGDAAPARLDGPVAALSDAATRPRTRPVAAAQVYTVQPGDSLAAISFRFYGETLLYTAIFEANRDKIDAPDTIRVGQKLTIPVL